MRSKCIDCSVWPLLLLMVIATSAAGGEKQAPVDRVELQRDRISQFTLPTGEGVARAAEAAGVSPGTVNRIPNERQSVGSALSPEAGIGVGASVDLTYCDAQQTHGEGRHISHWWNGEYGLDAEIVVHFGYRSMDDTTAAGSFGYSGYNVYDATGGTGTTWPRFQDVGCDLQAGDTAGWGSVSSLDVMGNGYAVMTSRSHLGNGFLGDGSAFVDNMVFYQASQFSCSYVPGLNATFIDSLAYRPLFLDPSDGNYSRHPQVVTQWDGANTIVHLLLFESYDTPLSGDDYADYSDYCVASYFRKVGETADGGSWSAGQIIDSLWFPWASMAAAPHPLQNVVVTYTNPSYWGALLNNTYDLDVWHRESLDLGLTWQPAEDMTNYTNAIAGDPNHFTAWLETQCLYSTDGDLHIVWTAKETSNDPYFDGFNWRDFNQNVYHWSRSTDDVMKVANGTYTDYWDWLFGSVNTYHCGYGGWNAGYIANVNIGECDDKLYCVWNQIHERANYMPWRDAPTQPAPGVLDNCSYTGNRLAMANWEILMSVCPLGGTTLWDMPRNITQTYTPNCGLPGDPDAEGLCASHQKPALEKYGLDETGLDLTWPIEALIDMTPETEAPYSGSHFINMQYLDDQFPGPSFWGWTNPPATENSLKWIRLACVESIEASEISVLPPAFWWPDWVELGQTEYLTVTVINDGNATLNITEIGYDDGGGGWLSVYEGPTPADPLQILPGVDHVGMTTIGVIVDASGFSESTWLDGEVWLKSDAINEDSTSIVIHLLAADHVEQVRWDTVASHEHMFDTYFFPQGACVALAISNMGEIGWGAGTSGSVNLDYVESELECGYRSADAIYLRSGSPFTILADDANGTNAELTCSYNDASQYDLTGWDPVGDLGSIRGGVAAGGEYDSVYTGRFVNRDTTIAMERTFYAPRSVDPVNETINFVISLTKVYSGDGQPHDHVTIGNMIDWDVPSERVDVNVSGVSSDGFLYVQGTDTTGVLSCQSHTWRYATEAFGGGYHWVEHAADSCANDMEDYYGFLALDQRFAEDTTHYRDGTPLDPPQPNPAAWYWATSVAGLNADATPMDQAVWLTYEYDLNLGSQDTMYYWTVLTTVRSGSLDDLEAQVDAAKKWYTGVVRVCPTGCCVGNVGNCNGLGGEEPTIGDISVMIDAKFITGTCEGIVDCIAECDMNQSGGCDPTCDDLTIGDVSTLIDYLFITGWQLGLPPCLQCNM